MRLMVTAIEFVNTVGGRTHATPVRYVVDRERMLTIDDLLEWAVKLGVVARRPRAKPGFLKRALQFREALYRIFKSMIDGRKPDAADLELLNRELAKARAHERLTIHGDHAAVVDDDRDSLEHLLRVIARSAADLLTSEQLSRVKLCGGESCGWLFLDTTRNRTRRWCDMRDCGNIAKVRRFRERRRGRT